MNHYIFNLNVMKNTKCESSNLIQKDFRYCGILSGVHSLSDSSILAFEDQKIGLLKKIIIQLA